MMPREGRPRDSLNLPVDDAEQLMASGDGDRLGEQIGGGERVLVPHDQRQELAELAVERTGRAAADAVESIFQELEDLVLRGDIWKGQSSKTPGAGSAAEPSGTWTHISYGA